jgi:hypothetical protein
LLLPQEVTSFFGKKKKQTNNHPKNNKMKILKHNQRRHAKLAYKISFIKNKTNGLHSSFFKCFGKPEQKTEQKNTHYRTTDYLPSATFLHKHSGIYIVYTSETRTNWD